MSGIGRHAGVFGSAWKAETERRRKETGKKVETEFLPAALEIMDTPPSPVGRLILWVIVGAAFAALGWSILSEVDVVAVAEGRVAPRGRLQAIETPEVGVVREIHVKSGDRVAAGDPLLSLDPTYAEADAETARVELAAASLVRARAQALLAYASGIEASFAPPDGASESAAATEGEVVRARIASFEARREALLHRREAAEAAARVAEQQVTLRQERLPLIEERYNAHKTLADRGHAPMLDAIELEEQVITMRREVVIQTEERDRALAEAASIDQELAQIWQDFRAQAATELAEAEATEAGRREALRAAERRSGLQLLAAPMDGVIHEVAVTTVGEVVEAGATLITLVPAYGAGEDELIIEASVLNKDVGFVDLGQSAIVKLQPYPFTRYGYLTGEVELISPDAVADEALGLVFPARVRLTATALSVDGREARLTPGMAATVEVVTGRRRVIEYLLSPIAKATGEAGRER